MGSFIRAWRQRAARRRERWESLCRRCGLCCFEKEIRGGSVYVRMDSPCRYLDPVTRLCRVYDKRFRVCRECARMRRVNAFFSKWLPETCGYVQHYRRRRGGARLRRTPGQ